jgi:formate dehydrogenase major subunit
VAACNLVVMLEIPEQDSSARRYGPTGRLLLGKGRHFRQLDRHFQRVRPALPPPGQARTDFDIIDAVASSLALNSAAQTRQLLLAECAAAAALFAGLSYNRLDYEGAVHWPCRSTDDSGEATLYLHRFKTPDGRVGWPSVSGRTCRRVPSIP